MLFVRFTDKQAALISEVLSDGCSCPSKYGLQSACKYSATCDECWESALYESLPAQPGDVIYVVKRNRKLKDQYYVDEAKASIIGIDQDNQMVVKIVDKRNGGGLTFVLDERAFKKKEDAEMTANKLNGKEVVKDD